MSQSRGDSEGLVHGHGWGVADYPDGMPVIEKQTWAAFHGEHFARKAANVYAHTVVAHVRRATVGEPSLNNTHPFSLGRWIFAHNGTIRQFASVRENFLDAMDFNHRNAIKGTTDSEHIFHYLLTLWSHEPQADLLDTLHYGLSQVIDWCARAEPDNLPSLNVVLTDGDQMVGSRMGRTLWSLARRSVTKCEVCGKPHVHHKVGEQYRSIEIASEPLTHDEDWRGIPDNTVFAVDDDYRLRFRPLLDLGQRSPAQ
jgi:glutamine amidotransferase